MKILYCNKYNFGFSGTEAYLFEAMELMRSRGHEVALFSMADSRGQATAYDHHFVPLTDFKRADGLAKRARLGMQAIYSLEARKKIGAMIADFRPEVAHVRNIYHHLSPSILWEMKSRGLPVLYHLNDFKLICPSYNLVSSSGEACERCKGGKFWNIVRERCYAGGMAASTVLAAEAYLHQKLGTYAECVDLILTPSAFAKQKLIENNWPSAKVQVLSHFQNLPLRSTSHPGNSAPILYFGRLSPEKGVQDLLAAMVQLPSVKLNIAGDGPMRAELEGKVQKLGLNNVRFLGHISGPSLEDLIADCQFTVFPSRAYETFGKSILESYAHGRAVIASDLGSRREVVKDGETGILYPVKNVDQLAEAIALLYDRPSLSKRMGETGRDLVRDRYSQEEHFTQLSQIYEDLVQARPFSLNRRVAQPLANRNLQGSPEIRKLRIAYIGGRGVIGKYSGIETYYEETGKRLVEMGHEVTAYCRSYFTPQTAQHDGMKIVRLPTLRSKHLERLVHTLLSTVHACFSRCEIVHYHTLGPALFSFLPRLFGKKTVVTVQGLDWQRNKWVWLARQALRLGEWASAKLPNRTVVVSQTLQERYRSRYSNRTAFVPNGTELRLRRTGRNLARLGLSPHGYILFLGRFSPEKNCHLLIEAFQQTTTALKLVLAGGSSHTDQYAASLRKNETERIRILDWLSGDALEEVLTNAALFVLPSDLEGMSLALLDAMGSGICVLTTDTPENREAIADAGFTFKRGDVQDLQRMLTMLLNDDDLRQTTGRLAQERVRQHYLWDEVAKKNRRALFGIDACLR